MFETLINRIYFEYVPYREIKTKLEELMEEVEELSQLFQIIIINIQNYSEKVRRVISVKIEEGKTTLKEYQ